MHAVGSSNWSYKNHRTFSLQPPLNKGRVISTSQKNKLMPRKGTLFVQKYTVALSRCGFNSKSFNFERKFILKFPFHLNSSFLSGRSHFTLCWYFVWICLLDDRQDLQGLIFMTTWGWKRHSRWSKTTFGPVLSSVRRGLWAEAINSSFPGRTQHTWTNRYIVKWNRVEACSSHAEYSMGLDLQDPMELGNSFIREAGIRNTRNPLQW